MTTVKISTNELIRITKDIIHTYEFGYSAKELFKIPVETTARVVQEIEAPKEC